MTVSQAVDEILRSRVFAVVGASRDPGKYGSIVLADLWDKGYIAYPINPNAAKILGCRVYPSIAALPAGVEALVLVVPPALAVGILRQGLASGIRRVWMQPGAESAEAVAFCEAHGIAAVSGLCLMMQPLASREDAR